MKPSDFEDISVSKILQFVQSVGLMNQLKDCTKDLSRSKCMGHWCPPFCTLLYSILFTV